MRSSDIKQIRKDLKLNQKDFGKALGVSLSAVQSWESGDRNMSETAEKLLKELMKKSLTNNHNVSASNANLNSTLSIFYNENGQNVSDEMVIQYVVRNLDRFIKGNEGLKKSIDIEALKVILKARKSDGTIDIDKIG